MIETAAERPGPPALQRGQSTIGSLSTTTAPALIAIFPAFSVLLPPQVSASSQLGTCVLEVALCVSQQLLGAGVESSSYAVGESVMARRMDGDFGEGTVLDTIGDGAPRVPRSAFPIRPSGGPAVP